MPDLRSLALLALFSSALVSCSSVEGSGAPIGDTDPPPAAGSATPKYLLIAIDRSGSRSPEEVRSDRAILSRLVDTLGYGDRVSILDVCEGARTEQCRPWTIDMPAPRRADRPSRRDSIALADAKDDIRAKIDRLLSRKGAPKGTNLFGTLRFVDDAVRGSRGAATLVLFSDMIQAAEGVNMARPQAIPDSGWIREALAKGRLPTLSSICVSAIGVADPGQELGQRVLRFWDAYFNASGAKFSRDRYRRFVQDVSPLFC